MDIFYSKIEKPPEPITVHERSEWINNFKGICLSSDTYFPFLDNIDRANKSNIKFIAQPGSSIRDDEVTNAVDEYGMVMVHTGIRLFLH